MTIVSPYLSIIALSANGLNAPNKRHKSGWMNNKQTRPNYMLPTRDSLQFEGHIYLQSVRMEKDIPSKWKPKESRGSYIYISKIDFK